MRAKYIHPFTNFGFIRLFGEENNKALLLDFLTALLPEVGYITTLHYQKPHQFGGLNRHLDGMFEVCFQNNEGEQFRAEIQKAKQNHFRGRTHYYSTFPIREQAEKGEWNYNLKGVFCIGILDFTFDGDETGAERTEVVHTVKLKNQHGRVFYDKLTYIYLEMPNFTKTEAELTTRLDKWLYFIKNLEDFQNIPAIFRDDIFTQAFETAELANLKPAEVDSYEASLKVFRDNKATFDYAMQTAREEGLAEGLAEGLSQGLAKGEAKGKASIARSMKAKGFSVEQIADLTGLSAEEIGKLRD